MHILLVLCLLLCYLLTDSRVALPASPCPRMQQRVAPSNATSADRVWLRRALRLALQARGRTRPNPCVGCIIVDSEGNPVGEGFHERAGLPHAEVVALAQAGQRARNGTAYVTLEPCNHYGRTPPCTLALLRAGIRRVVAGLVDPDPRVSGQGLALLQSKQIEVCLVDGMESAACRDANLPFIHRVVHKAPYCTLLLDTGCNLGADSFSDADDRIAQAVGDMDTIVINTSYLQMLSKQDGHNISMVSAGSQLLQLFPKHMDIVVYGDSLDLEVHAQCLELVHILVQSGRKATRSLLSAQEILWQLAREAQCNGVVLLCHFEQPTGGGKGENSGSRSYQRVVEVLDDNTLRSTNYWTP